MKYGCFVLPSFSTQTSRRRSDCPSVLPQRLEHLPEAAADLGINQRRLSTILAHSPRNGIEMELLIAFIEE